MRTIKEIALAITIVTTLFGANAFFASAQTPTPSGIPFGGFITAFVPPTPLCPVAHSLVFDFVSFNLIGVAVVPGSQVYLNGNLALTGTSVLGTYFPTPITCLVPYLIVPISQVGTS